MCLCQLRLYAGSQAILIASKVEHVKTSIWIGEITGFLDLAHLSVLVFSGDFLVMRIAIYVRETGARGCRGMIALPGAVRCGGASR